MAFVESGAFYSRRRQFVLRLSLIVSVASITDLVADDTQALFVTSFLSSLLLHEFKGEAGVCVTFVGFILCMVSTAYVVSLMGEMAPIFLVMLVNYFVMLFLIVVTKRFFYKRE